MEDRQIVTCPYCGYKSRVSGHEKNSNAQVRCEACKREIRTKTND